jgi:hypothetical protein
MARQARRAGRHASTWRRLVATVWAATTLLILGAFGATAGAQTTPDVVPIVSCSFLDAGTGMYNTVWSYRNQTTGPKRDVAVPIGSTNRFDSPGASAGQPTVFKAGTDQNAFIVTHKGSSTWTLTSHTATAPGPTCSSNPVPIVSSGWAPLVTLGAVTALFGGVVFWRTRRAARARRA